MAQIVSAKLNEKGNYVLEVKPLPEQRLSSTGDSVHVAGVTGWAEELPGLTIKDPEGNDQQLRATVDIRYINPHKKPKKPLKPLTAEDLKKGG